MKALVDGKEIDVDEKIKNELDKHEKLKWTAIKYFSERTNYTLIKTEVLIYFGHYEHVIVDIAIKTESRDIVIECGSISKKAKLNNLYHWFVGNTENEVYVLPFGETIPYKWKPYTEVCYSCGHIIGQKNVNILKAPDQHYKYNGNYREPKFKYYIIEEIEGYGTIIKEFRNEIIALRYYENNKENCFLVKGIIHKNENYRIELGE